MPNKLVVSATLLMSAGIYYADLVTPLGATEWVLYFLPLLFSYWAGPRQFPYQLAGLFTVLVTAGWIYAPTGVGVGLSLANRLIGLCVLWTTAALLVRRRQSEEELRELTARLRALAAHLESVREEEAKRIAREIHDELGQTLTGFKLEVSWIRSQLAKHPGIPDKKQLLERADSVAGSVDAMIKSVRELCTQLRPRILDDLGLVPAIEWLAREFGKRSSLRIEVAAEADAPLDPQLATALFRSLQELLTNVARHASATEVRVALKRTGDALVLEVHDNGRGITAEEVTAAKSLGLVGIRERMAALGGSLALNGAPGNGTIAVLTIPNAGAKPPVQDIANAKS